MLVLISSSTLAKLERLKDLDYSDRRAEVCRLIQDGELNPDGVTLFKYHLIPAMQEKKLSRLGIDYNFTAGCRWYSLSDSETAYWKRLTKDLISGFSAPLTRRPWTDDLRLSEIRTPIDDDSDSSQSDDPAGQPQTIQKGQSSDSIPSVKVPPLILLVNIAAELVKNEDVTTWNQVQAINAYIKRTMEVIHMHTLRNFFARSNGKGLFEYHAWIAIFRTGFDGIDPAQQTILIAASWGFTNHAYWQAQNKRLVSGLLCANSTAIHHLMGGRVSQNHYNKASAALSKATRATNKIIKSSWPTLIKSCHSTYGSRYLQ